MQGRTVFFGMTVLLVTAGAVITGHDPPASTRWPSMTARARSPSSARSPSRRMRRVMAMMTTGDGKGGRDDNDDDGDGGHGVLVLLPAPGTMIPGSDPTGDGLFCEEHGA
jgi:hypothetical protein